MRVIYNLDEISTFLCGSESDGVVGNLSFKFRFRNFRKDVASERPRLWHKEASTAPVAKVVLSMAGLFGSVLLR